MLGSVLPDQLPSTPLRAALDAASTATIWPDEQHQHDEQQQQDERVDERAPRDAEHYQHNDEQEQQVQEKPSFFQIRM